MRPSGRSVCRKALYARYRRWCMDVGREPATDQIFGRDLRAAVPRLGTSQPRVKGIRQRHYTGLRLREIDEEDDEGEQVEQVEHVPNHCTRRARGTARMKGI